MVHVFWLSGMSCDGCSVAMIGASNPGVEDMALDRVPDLPLIVMHHPMISEESGHELMAAYAAAADGSLGAPYIVVLEGSIPDDQALSAGHLAAMGTSADWPRGKRLSRSGDQPVRTTDWMIALAPGAAACIAIGTCATWGGIPAAAGNVTGSMSLMDFLGGSYRSARGVPVINVPGCAPQGDNFTETLAGVARYIAGTHDLPEFDELGRPSWLFEQTVHRHCPKAGYYEEGVFAEEPGDNQCLVEIGCWGPVVQCNIVERGAINHVGGCMVAGGACIGCTMPGFPDKYSPFYKSPPGSAISGGMTKVTGSGIRRLRRLSMAAKNREPIWDRSHDAGTGWGAANSLMSFTQVDKVNGKFYKKLQYKGSVDHSARNALQPQPQSMDILRQKGVDMEASVDVLQEHVVTREEL
ncbi:MAG: hydrogenase expression protein HypE [Solirubrobacterales bacterium]|nr:hydrogenase expression protein HypE [Solirubrobacterales bacterium]